MEDKSNHSKNTSSFRRIVNKLLSILAKKEMIPGYTRAKLHRLRGVNFQEVGSTFIGDNVTIDSISPENLSIGRRCQIGSGTKIVTHFVDLEKFDQGDRYYYHFYNGKVVIEDDVFLGFNVVIAAPVTIGKGSIVGANTVITRDVPPGTIVSGSPARVVKEFRDGKFQSVLDPSKYK